MPPIRERKDNRIDLPVEKRRLDSLSNLMVSRLMCVATVILDKKIHIAGNKAFTTGAAKGKLGEGGYNKQGNIPYIKELFAFLGGIAKNPGVDIDISKKKELFMEICVQSPNISPHDIVKKVADAVFGSKGERLNPDGVDFLRENPGLKKEGIGSALLEASLILHDLNKIIKTLREKPNGVGENKEGRELFVNAIKEEPVFVDSYKPDIHAEMRLLEVIIAKKAESKLDEKDLYIGISKLCCLKCECFLTAVQEVFKTDSINIEFGGMHDQYEENWKWNPPSGIPNEIFDENASFSQILDQNVKAICCKASQLFGEKKDQAKPTGGQIKNLSLSVSREASHDREQSPSEIYFNIMKTKLDVNKWDLDQQPKDKKLLLDGKLIELGLTLSKSDTFKRIVNLGDATIENLTASFNSIVAEMGEDSTFVDVNNLCHFLKNPRFASKKIADYFAAFDESVLKEPSPAQPDDKDESEKVESANNDLTAKADTGQSQHQEQGSPSATPVSQPNSSLPAFSNYTGSKSSLSEAAQGSSNVSDKKSERRDPTTEQREGKPPQPKSTQ